MSNSTREKAPISKADRAMLRSRLRDLESAAKAKGATLDEWDKRDETFMGTQFFELGCWLWYYRNRVSRVSHGGTKDRIDCARVIFMSGLMSIGYSFFTAFDFGERQFDSIFESGDANEVIDGLRKHLRQDRTGKMKAAFKHFGWPVSLEEKKVEPVVEVDPRQIGFVF